MDGVGDIDSAADSPVDCSGVMSVAVDVEAGIVVGPSGTFVEAVVLSLPTTNIMTTAVRTAMINPQVIPNRNALNHLGHLVQTVLPVESAVLVLFLVSGHSSGGTLPSRNRLNYWPKFIRLLPVIISNG